MEIEEYSAKLQLLETLNQIFFKKLKLNFLQ